MSTSSVSKTIARFKVTYGVKLLHRSTHALSLTDDGRQLIEPALRAHAPKTMSLTCVAFAVVRFSRRRSSIGARAGGALQYPDGRDRHGSQHLPP
jgi:hypothetical protein